MTTSVNPNILWGKEREDFDEWRRNNDLPLLFDYFNQALPHFPEWVNEFKFSLPLLIKYDRPSQLFDGLTAKYLWELNINSDTQLMITEITPNRHCNQLKDFYERDCYTVSWEKKFLPYFLWIKKTKGLRYFKLPNDRNNSVVDNFEYRLWSGGNYFISRAHLFSEFPVLKLGGITLHASRLDDRNLDFVDLDGLIITDRKYARSTEISYSSCRGISVQKAEIHHIRFNKCLIEGMDISDSSVQDLHFSHSNVRGFRIKDTYYCRSSFNQSCPSRLDIQNSDLSDIYIRNLPSEIPFQSKSELFRRVRTAYQRKGKRKDAGECFYDERKYEMLANIWPSLDPLEARNIHGSWNGVVRTYYFYKLNRRLRSYICEHIPRRIWQQFKWVVNLRNIKKSIYSKSKGIADLIDWSIWGFGEKPIRVFIFISIAVLIQTIWKLKIFSNVESIVGMILIGVMIAGFSNRTRY